MAGTRAANTKEHKGMNENEFVNFVVVLGSQTAVKRMVLSLGEWGGWVCGANGSYAYRP